MRIQNISFGVSSVDVDTHNFTLGLSFNFDWLNMKDEKAKQLINVLPTSFLFWTFYLYVTMHNIEFVEVDKWTND